MARYTFPCPHCRQTVSVVSTPGALTRCRKCREEVRVPLEIEAPRRTARCEGCGREFETNTPPGKRVGCPGCGESVRVPLRVTAMRGEAEAETETDPETEAETETETETEAEAEAEEKGIPGIVVTCGLATTFLAQLAVAGGFYLEPPVCLVGFYWCMVPVGALVFGTIAASGYVYGARRFARGRARGAFPYVVVGLVWLDYFVAHLHVWARLRPEDAEGNPLGALQWFDLTTRQLGGLPWDWLGYGLRALEIAAIGLGTWYVYGLAHPTRWRFQEVERSKMILPHSWRPRENPFKRGGRL